MLMAKSAPGSFGSNTVDGGYMFEVSQKYPFCGKLKLRGENALAEARAAGLDVADVRLQLIESARSAFYDYYLAERSIAVNDESLKLLRDFRENAASRYKTGLVPEQDVLQADVEIGREQERRLTLEESRNIAIAHINTLLHLPPDHSLAPPPGKLPSATPVPDVQELRDAAIASRPDLQALTERVQAEEANLALAQKEFYPDFEVAASYDAFWQERPLRPAVGVRMNLPVRTSRRYGAIAEAEARLSRRHAELDKQIDQVNFQVQQAYEQLRSAEKSVALYEKTILPAAEANRKAAQAAYVTGKIPFLSLIEAQRNQVNLRDRYNGVVADYFRRRAALERMVGSQLESRPSSNK
jgi:outer membrane protein TolC